MTNRLHGKPRNICSFGRKGLSQSFCSWILVMLSVASPVLSAESLVWSSIRSGESILLLRHALAPGVGDPPHFDLSDCTTQRNLSTEGREQARRIGQRLRDNGVASARVFSSAWCRCLDTARALALGPLSTLPELNSFFANPQREAPQTEALAAWLTQQPRDTPLILVTHQVNITGLTGVVPQSGEMIVMRMRPDGTVEVVGRLRP